MKLKKGDEILVTGGKDKGKRGKIEKLDKSKGRALVPGLNVYKRHLKPRGEGQKGGIIDVSRPIPFANLALVCPKCGKQTRAGFIVTGKEKTRICRKCKQVV